MYNFIDGDFFESLCDYSFGDMYSSNMSQPNYEILKYIFDRFELPKIFIETHRLGILFRELNNFIDRECIIICHNSDATFGEEIIPHIPRNVKKLFCQNYNYIETEVIKSLPIGLERVRWFPEQQKQQSLFEMISKNIQRDELVYMNFNPSTNPIRSKIYEDLKNKKFINVEMVGNGGNYNEYLVNLKKHKFIISPPGNGIDCHRNWESLYLGCIPILLNSHFVRNTYRDFPVLVVEDYSIINNNFLSSEISKIKTNSDNINIIKNNYLNYENR
jgi:hypothetical protein